jgi:uncharacterized protein (UPF0212 family)
VSAEQEYCCEKCGYEWETDDLGGTHYSGCPRCKEQRDGAAVARDAHNVKVVSSNLTPATSAEKAVREIVKQYGDSLRVVAH